MEKFFVTDSEVEQEEWELTTFRDFFDQFDQLVYMNAILDSFDGEKEMAKKRLRRLIEITGMEACGLRDEHGRVGFPPEIADLIKLLVRKMDDGYMAEVARKGHALGTLDERMNKVLAFREEMIPEIEKMADPNQRDFGYVLLDTIANQAEAETIKELLARLKAFEKMCGHGERPLRVAAYQRLSDSLADIISWMIGGVDRK